MNMSDSDTEDGLMSKALYVEPATGEEGDPNLPPTSGHEYLRRVHEEAKHCPKIVVANIDTSKFLENQTVTVPQSQCPSAPDGFAPSHAWQIDQVADFSELRFKIASYRSQRKNGGVSAKSSIKLPNINDDVGWCQLCFGSVPPTHQKSNLEQLSSEEGMPPLLSFVCAMTQPLVEQVLTFHISWMELTGFTPQQGRWFYALLACLEKPLTPEACSSLRSLARCCAHLRLGLTSKEDCALIPLNLLICLVACYFDQQDLADGT